MSVIRRSPAARTQENNTLLFRPGLGAGERGRHVYAALTRSTRISQSVPLSPTHPSVILVSNLLGPPLSIPLQNSQKSS